MNKVEQTFLIYEDYGDKKLVFISNKMKKVGFWLLANHTENSVLMLRLVEIRGRVALRYDIDMDEYGRVSICGY